MSYSYLSITCTTPAERVAVKDFLLAVTPFDEIDEKLVYMTLKSDDVIPVPTMLEDVICLLQEHQDKFASVSKNFNCKLELVAKSPLSCTVEKFDSSILSFAKSIGATIRII